MPNNNQLKASDILRELHELLQEPELDIAALSLKDVQAELTRRGIDTKPLLTRAKQQLAKAHAEKELSEARNQREGLLQRLNLIKGKLVRTPAILREHILSTLGNLATENPTVAAAYFSKFEEASDDDLQSLMDDLNLLDESGDDKNSPGGA
jgi:hypothetical protein